MAARNRSRRSGVWPGQRIWAIGQPAKGPGRTAGPAADRRLWFNQFEGLVGHRRSIAVHHAAGQVRIADVEMRFRDDDHSLQAWARRRANGLRAHAGIAAWRNNVQNRIRDAKRSSAGRELGYVMVMCFNSLAELGRNNSGRLVVQASRLPKTWRLADAGGTPAPQAWRRADLLYRSSLWYPQSATSKSSSSKLPCPAGKTGESIRVAFTQVHRTPSSEW